MRRGRSLARRRRSCVCAAVALPRPRRRRAPRRRRRRRSAASRAARALVGPPRLLPARRARCRSTTFIDLGAPDALATIASGPTTFARASAADPGDLLASPETLLTNASKDYPAGTVPNYPYRVSATSGLRRSRPPSRSPPRVCEPRSRPTRAARPPRATMPRAAAPAVATFGSMSAYANTTTDGSTVTVHVKTSMSDFNLLGHPHDRLDRHRPHRHLGRRPTTKLTGGTTVSGASVLGTPVTIDAKGIHGSPRTRPTSPGSAG